MGLMRANAGLAGPQLGTGEARADVAPGAGAVDADVVIARAGPPERRRGHEWM